jgi:threonine dehydratase
MLGLNARTAFMLQPLDKLFKRIQDAQKRLSGQAHVTPVVTSRTLDRKVGTSV